MMGACSSITWRRRVGLGTHDRNERYGRTHLSISTGFTLVVTTSFLPVSTARSKSFPSPTNLPNINHARQSPNPKSSAYHKKPFRCHNICQFASNTSSISTSISSSWHWLSHRWWTCCWIGSSAKRIGVRSSTVRWRGWVGRGRSVEFIFYTFY